MAANAAPALVEESNLREGHLTFERADDVLGTRGEAFRAAPAVRARAASGHHARPGRRPQDEGGRPLDRLGTAPNDRQSQTQEDRSVGGAHGREVYLSGARASPDSVSPSAR